MRGVWPWAVLAGAALVFLARLGDRAVVSEEVRWAQVAREMRDTGDWLHPTFNGRTYFDKPVGSYWLIAAAARLTGTVDEWTARLPAALAGLLGVGVVMRLGRRLYGPAAGLAAGAVLATSFGYAFYARRATADLETVVGVLVAVWLYACRTERPGGTWVLGLWAWMAAVSLTKGLLGFALPLAVFAADALLAAWAAPGRRRATLRESLGWLVTPWTALAVPLAVGLYLTPFLLAEGRMADGLAMVWRENVRRFVAPHNHLGPVWLYAAVIFLLAAPWSAFLPAALLPTPRPDVRDRLARAYFWAVFLFFTASASRRSYYLLPVLPAAALLIGRVLTANPDGLTNLARRLRAAGWGLLALGAALSGLLLVPPAWVLPAPYDRLPPLPGRGWVLAGWLAALGVLVARRLRPGLPKLPLAATGAFAAFAFGFGVVHPAADDLRTRRDFVLAARECSGGDPGGLALYRAGEVVFELGRLASDFADPAELAAAVRDGRARRLILPRKRLSEAPAGGSVVAEEAARPWEPPDQLENKLLLVEYAP